MLELGQYLLTTCPLWGEADERSHATSLFEISCASAASRVALHYSVPPLIPSAVRKRTVHQHERFEPQNGLSGFPLKI